MSRRDGTDQPTRDGYEITKQAVASSQLATAVWLWANEWDPVSVHVLASAAAEVIGVIRRSNGDLLIESEILSSLASEFDEKFEAYLKTSYNFMKHGARLRTHSQKSTVAARAMADRKTVGHRS